MDGYVWTLHFGANLNILLQTNFVYFFISFLIVIFLVASSDLFVFPHFSNKALSKRNSLYLSKD